MSYRLKKPITDKERADFIVEYNHNQGLIIQDGTDTYEDDELILKGDFIFALELNEMMDEVEVEIDVPDEIEEGEEQQTYHKEITTVYKPIIDSDYEEKQAARRQSDFNKAFFLTSLGYIRRSVTMADGSKKDFLSDLLPVISMGVQGGMPVNILTYDKPPFDEDVTDWTEYQHQVVVTPQFIQECFLQLSNDFLPINEEENEDTIDQSEL